MEIERPKIETASLSPDGRYGKFVVEPLERGFGTTLGNSLRRVLLSSLPGVAVTSVKIDGVVHEFSTIEGVREDVTEIVLNLKGVAAKIYGESPKTVRVEAVGPCELIAGSIKGGDDLEILNPEWHIATLGEGAKLVMELTFDKGRGYVPAERNKLALIEKNDINQIYDVFGIGGSYEIKTQVVGVGSAVSEMFTAPVDVEKHTGLCVILDREALLYVSTVEQILKWNRNCGVHLLLASYGNGKIAVNGEEKLSLVMTSATFYPGSNGIARK